MEVRHVPLKQRFYWLARSGTKTIFGFALMGSSELIKDTHRWKELFPRHKVDTDSLPYKLTYGTPLERVVRTTPFPYFHPQGAQGIVVFRKAPSDEVVKTPKATPKLKRQIKAKCQATMAEKSQSNEHEVSLVRWRRGKMKKSAAAKKKQQNACDEEGARASLKRKTPSSPVEDDSDIDLFQKLKQNVLEEDQGTGQRGKNLCSLKGNQHCIGNQESICRFNTIFIGQRARVNPKRGETQCFFCNEEAMNKKMQIRAGHAITRALTIFREKDSQIYEDALQRLSRFQDDLVRKEFEFRITRVDHRKTLKTARDVSATDRWRQVLTVRECPRKFTEEEEFHHAAEVRKQEKKLREKLPAIYSLGEGHRLRKDWQTLLASRFEDFAKFKSWAVCSSCSRLVPQKFLPGHVSQPARLKLAAANCKYCETRGAVGYWAPQPKDVPKRLRDIPGTVLDALRLFDVDIGLPDRAKAGYFAHTNMIRFRWHSRSVEDRLVDLKGNDWRAGRKAFRHLMQSTESSYRKFKDTHDVVLHNRDAQANARYEDPEQSMPMLPMRFIETVGLECCIWPHLYWRTDMCETYVRSMDSRRLARSKKRKRDAIRGDSEISDMEEKVSAKPKPRRTEGDELDCNSSSTGFEEESEELKGFSVNGPRFNTNL
eukprot:11045214-Karenia_brevis.AAC.2